MENKYLFLISLFLCLLFFERSHSQELRSGEITVQQVSPLSDFHIQATITIYTDAFIPVRPYLHVFWGDGSSDSIPFGAMFPLNNCDINYYSFIYIDHFYPGYGYYLISINEPFYVGGINNIQNSSNESLQLLKDVNISTEIGINSSPQFPYPQDCEWLCCQIYNPVAYDSDGDSLSYELIPCIVSNYVMPIANIDSVTGDFYFIPDSIGKYAIAVKINEWRFYQNGFNLIGSTTRQMLFDVTSLVSINEVEPLFRIELFPNPTQDFIYLKIYDLMITKITISSLFGSICFINNDFNIIKPIDIRNLCQGIYFLIIETDKGQILKKFVKK